MLKNAEQNIFVKVAIFVKCLNELFPYGLYQCYFVLAWLLFAFALRHQKH